MTHDPLCHLCRETGEFNLMADRCYYCKLIAKVRADTVDKAVQRVEKNVLVGMTLTPKEVRAVIAAVRGES